MIGLFESVWHDRPGKYGTLSREDGANDAALQIGNIGENPATEGRQNVRNCMLRRPIDTSTVTLPIAKSANPNYLLRYAGVAGTRPASAGTMARRTGLQRAVALVAVWAP